MLTQSLAKFRQEDKLALRRQNRFCNSGGHGQASTFGVISDNKAGYRPPSSTGTYNSTTGVSMQIRNRFQKKQTSTVVRNSHSNTNKASSGLVKKQ